MIELVSFFLGMAFAFIVSAACVVLIVWHEQKGKRLAAFEQFEHGSSGDYP